MTALFRKAEESGITVEYCHIPLNEPLSVQDTAGDFILMDYSLVGAGAKERVHLGHELGHCETGSFYYPRAKYDIRQKHENRADKWAISHLVPEDAFNHALADGHTELWSLADHFGVTEEFMRKAVCWYVHGNLSTELYF